MKIEEYNQERARVYSKAMTQFPNARTAELTSLDIGKHASKQITTILDLGAGDGFLTKYLSKMYPQAKIYAVDSSRFMLDNFKKNDNITFIHAESDQIPLEDASVDIVVSLATFHHIDRKQETFNEINRVLSNEGVFILADVLDETKTQEFFDTVVRNHCITGHDFPFLYADWVKDLANKSKLNYENTSLKETPWKFKDRESMAMFIKNLMGLELSLDSLLKSLFETFPIAIGQNEVSLKWQLGYHVLRKQETTIRKPNYIMSLEEKKQYIEIIKDMPWLYDPILNSISKHIDNVKDIVDIGCGSGHLLNLINLRYPDIKLSGIDNDHFFIERASKECPHNFIKDCGTKTNIFGDLLISNLAFHHIKNPNKFINNLYKNSKKTLIISDQVRPKTKQELQQRLKKRKKIVGNKDKPFYEENETDSILEAYSKEEIIRILDSLNIEYSIKFLDNDYYERFVAIFTKKSNEVQE